MGELYIDEIDTDAITTGNLKLQTGIYNSALKNCVVQKNAAIHNVAYINNYLIEADCVMLNIGQINCTPDPSFGCGDDKRGNNWIEIANENGGRKILPFEDILTADAWLWSRHRDDILLQNRLKILTSKTIENNRLTYGIIGHNSSVAHVKSIEDCRIGAHCQIRGASRLNNMTIQSSAEEPVFIGEDVHIENGLVSYGSRIESAAKCINIIAGRNVKIEMGARVRHTFIGSNSTIACGEVSNNLLFPFHEQHHNNSFLIASTIMGQANIAAGATIGSNHNSRAADGEIIAGRGFWPGLVSDFKHNSVFASFTLIAKGSYENELNVSLPFSLVSKNPAGNLQIFPGFWFRHNMYALARNAWKFSVRDKRKIKDQHIETEYLAPDTLFEIAEAIKILKKAVKMSGTKITSVNYYSFNKVSDLNNVWLEGMAARQKTFVIKPLQAIWIYGNIILFAAAVEIIDYILENSELPDLEQDKLPGVQRWQNFGGQLISNEASLGLINDIKKENITSWQEIHNRYHTLWQKYESDKLHFSLACWAAIDKKISTKTVEKLIRHSIKFNNLLLEWTIEARGKDYVNPFRQSTYQNIKEMEVVTGAFGADPFLIQTKKQNEAYLKKADTAISILKGKNEKN